MKRAASIASIIALVAVAIAVAEDGGEAPRSRITRTEVWLAVASELRTRGVGARDWPRVEDIDLPVAVPALAGRNLLVSSVCWDATAARARFRIECRAAGACLPFLVYVRDTSGTDAQAPACRLQQSERRPAAPRPQSLVHPGQRATAVLSTKGLRMTAAVTCLERGAQGEIVRVRGPEGRIFRARVAGHALLEALAE